jgi:predicted RNase H-like nuclease
MKPKRTRKDVSKADLKREIAGYKTQLFEEKLRLEQVVELYRQLRTMLENLADQVARNQGENPQCTSQTRLDSVLYAVVAEYLHSARVREVMAQETDRTKGYEQLRAAQLALNEGIKLLSLP